MASWAGRLEVDTQEVGSISKRSLFMTPMILGSKLQRHVDDSRRVVFEAEAPLPPSDYGVRVPNQIGLAAGACRWRNDAEAIGRRREGCRLAELEDAAEGRVLGTGSGSVNAEAPDGTTKNVLAP